MDRITMELSPDERKIILAYRKGGCLDVIDILKVLIHQEEAPQRKGVVIPLGRTPAADRTQN